MSQHDEVSGYWKADDFEDTVALMLLRREQRRSHPRQAQGADMSENIVTRLAREAELVWFKSSGEARLMLETEDFDPMPDLRRFAALVAEECARIIEAQGVDPAFKGRMAWAVRDRFKA